MTSLIVLNGCCTVQLTKGQVTLIDAYDLPKLGGYRWMARSNGYAFYAVRNEHVGHGSKNRKYRTHALHRVLKDAPPEMQVDHRDGDTLNNTQANLRLSTPSENKRNRRRACGTSRFKGVSRQKYAWYAKIVVDKRQIHLGAFATEEEAARAYDAAAIEMHGSFACTNADLFGEY